MSGSAIAHSLLFTSCNVLALGTIGLLGFQEPEWPQKRPDALRAQQSWDSVLKRRNITKKTVICAFIPLQIALALLCPEKNWYNNGLNSIYFATASALFGGSIVVLGLFDTAGKFNHSVKSKILNTAFIASFQFGIGMLSLGYAAVKGELI